jgi:broad specificity phosphatase PhoE
MPIERFRGSSEIPLTDKGVAAAQTLALQLAKRGGLSEIHASSMGRTVNTARIISNYTHAPIVYIGDGLHPWHLGGLEGQVSTPEFLDYQKRLIAEAPDQPVPGRGPLSIADGESFNDFRQRTIGKLQELVNAHSAQPDRAVGVVTHYRVKKLLDAWVKAGMGKDGEVDTQEMIAHSPDNKPGGVELFRMDKDLGPSITPVDLDSQQRLMGGLYIIRHEATPWNTSDDS